jgi:D-alanine-D-alanine ligase
VDVVFPVLHGPYGEDGTIQGLLELAGVPYVGAGVLASAAAMDKEFTKKLLAAEGLPVGDWVVLRPGTPTLTAEQKQRLGLPVFVKPARAGSSMGISRIGDPTDLAGLRAAVEFAREHDPKVVVEAGIEGREIECGVMSDLAGGPPLTSLPGEIEVVGGGHTFYDFEAKYLDEASVRLSCPADLPDSVSDRVREIAARTFVAMGCEGLARVDVFVLRDGSVVVNELNTMPGFTPFSMFPRMWEKSGVSYRELVDRLLQLALTRPVGLR